MISTAPSAQVGGAVNPGVHVGGAVNAGAAVRGAITPGVLGASGASTTASATTQASGGGINGSYSTAFPLTENPISEGGSWTNGGATGLGWENVQTTPGLSFGTGPVNAGTYLYADPTAVLKGVWAQDQQVQATVKVRGAFDRACCKDIGLLIRMTITRISITGYELNCSVVSAGPYLTLVRWNGPLNNFTYIVRNAYLVRQRRRTQTHCCRQYLHRLQKRRTGPPGHRRHIPEGFSGRRLLQQRRHQLEWIRFEQLLGEQCRVFRHHSAQDARPRLARADPGLYDVSSV